MTTQRVEWMNMHSINNFNEKGPRKVDRGKVKKAVPEPLPDYLRSGWKGLSRDGHPSQRRTSGWGRSSRRRKRRTRSRFRSGTTSNRKHPRQCDQNWQNFTTLVKFLEGPDFEYTFAKNCNCAVFYCCKWPNFEHCLSMCRIFKPSENWD